MIAAIFLTLLIAPQLSPAERRARAYDRAAEIASVNIPGVDFSDSSVIAAAHHFCGTTEQCEQWFKVGRDKLTVAYAVNRNHRHALLSIIKSESEGQFVNWHTSLDRYEAKFHPPRKPAPRVQCYSRIDRFGATSYCIVFE